MSRALELAKIALDQGEVPVGCVIIKNQEIIGEGHNLTNKLKNGTKHCEFIAIYDALSKNPEVNLNGAEVYVTCEPCIMCAEALVLVGISKVYFGCYNERFGGNGSVIKINEG
jgi:tRNA-specific adenosine deaminase 2